MAYSRRRSGTSRRSYSRGTVSSRRETFQAKQWGRFGLTSANQVIEPLNLLEHYENLTTPTSAGGVDVNNCTILGIRGWITFFLSDNTELPAAGTDARMGFGIRTMSSTTATQIDSLAERQAIAPYALGLSAWDNWIWRRSRPMWPKATVPEGSTLGYDRIEAAWTTKFGINTHNMRKLRRGESLYLMGGLNFDPGSGGDIECIYELNTALAKP